MARIGLVTVTYNSAQVLPDFLASVREAQRTSEHDVVLYAIDNASTDQTLELLGAAVSTGVVVLPQECNLGVAKANNIGLRRALSDGCDDVVLLNNDTYFGPALFDELVQASRESGGIPVVPLILATDPPDTLWYAGGDISPRRAYKVTHRLLGAPSDQAPARAARQRYAPTCCLLIPAKVIREVGLMDESFFVYGDDTDFNERLAAKGFSPLLWPESVLHHKASSLTGGTTGAFGVTHATRAQIVLIRKYLRPLPRMLAFGYLLAYSIARLLVRRDPPRICRLRLRACFEGWRIALLPQPALDRDAS